MNRDNTNNTADQDPPKTRRGRALRRGLPLLPSLFTSGNLFCGFLSAMYCLEGGYEEAALLIMVAGVLDMLDGGIARLTDSESPFGLQYDSLADMVSFGLAPALLAEGWALRNLPRLGWSISFLFVACCAVRLARFNTQSGSVDRRWFIGLPSPIAAGVVAALVFASPAGPVENPWALALVVSLLGAVGLLMVSQIRYRSLKDVDLKRRRPHQIVLGVAIALVVTSLAPRLVVLTVAMSYVLSGPIYRVYLAMRSPKSNKIDPSETTASTNLPEEAEGEA